MLTDAAARQLRWHSAPPVDQMTIVKTTTAESLIAADVAEMAPVLGWQSPIACVERPHVLCED
jgi:hypothetical protein